MKATKQADRQARPFKGRTYNMMFGGDFGADSPCGDNLCEDCDVREADQCDVVEPSGPSEDAGESFTGE